MAVQLEKKTEGVYLLDVKGYVCPHPQLYMKKSLEKMKPGDILELVFDNPSSAESILAMCDAQGNDILEQGKDDQGAMRWRIRKAID